MEDTRNTVLSLAFLVLLFHLAKAFGIAAPSWHLARAEVARLRGTVDPVCKPGHRKEGEPQDAGGADRVEELLQEAERVLNTMCKRTFAQPLLFLYFLFWNGQREMGAWRLLHEAERQAVNALCDPQVQARLKRALGELEELSKEKACAWRRHLESALKEQAEEGAEGRKALLQNFLADLYDARDSKYAQLLTLHNKATYLFWLGLVLAWGILHLWPGGSFHPLFLFLAGLGGGLLSRLMRVVGTARLPTDYGAYWVPLFLSTLLGGLAALLGVLVVELGVALKVLGEGVVGLLQPPSVYGLGVGLGFSERLFQGLSRRVEDTLVPKTKEDKKDGEGTPREPTSSGKPPQGDAGGRQDLPMVHPRGRFPRK